MRQAHLARLGLVDENGRARRRVVAMGNRNLGTNHGHVAWQRGETPPVLRIPEDPADSGVHSCLVARRSGALSIEDLRFEAGGFISPTVDYRPPGTSAIAVLKGPLQVDLPGGSVSYSVA